MALRDKKTYGYSVDPEIIRNVDNVEKWLCGEIDFLAYDAYMRGRKDQLQADLFACTWKLKMSYDKACEMLLPLLPKEYMVTAENVARYRVNFLVGYYSEMIKAARRIMEKLSVDLETAMAFLDYDQECIDFCQAAQNVDDNDMERFAYRYAAGVQTTSSAASNCKGKCAEGT